MCWTMATCTECKQNRKSSQTFLHVLCIHSTGTCCVSVGTCVGNMLTQLEIDYIAPTEFNICYCFLSDFIWGCCLLGQLDAHFIVHRRTKAILCIVMMPLIRPWYIWLYQDDSGWPYGLFLKAKHNGLLTGTVIQWPLICVFHGQTVQK